MAGVLYRALANGRISKRERYDRLRSALWTQRSSFDTHWRELGDFFLPRRTRFWAGDRNKGDRRNQNIIDSTGRFAARTLQSGLHAGLTSPARPWFKLTTPDPTLAEHPPVKEWLHLVTQRMQVVFADSNLYNSLPIVYGDMGVFATAAMAVLEDSQDLFRCQAYPIGSYAIAQDARGMVTTFVRDYELSVRQIVEQFGVRRGYRDIDWTPLSRTIKNAWDNGQYEDAIELCWVVTPNEAWDPTKIAGPDSMRWSSCHFEKGSDENKFLREAGFATFPILAPRWDITGEDSYGTDCPGMTALGDVKQLQIQQKEKGKAIKKKVDPPMVGAAELRGQKTSILPGDVTYLTDVQHGFKAAHEVNLDLGDLREDMNETRYRIQRAFFEDLFLMLATSDQQLGAERPTAREIDERHEEKLLALGPVLERTNDELLDPLVDRVFFLMDEAGLLPEPPEELQGVNLKVEYISILAQAQKLVAVGSLDRFVASITPIAEAFPETVFKIDPNQLVDSYADALSPDPRIVRTTEEARRLAGEAARREQGIADAQEAALVARAAKDASGAKLGQGSALDQLMGAGGGQ